MIMIWIKLMLRFLKLSALLILLLFTFYQCLLWLYNRFILLQNRDLLNLRQELLQQDIVLNKKLHFFYETVEKYLQELMQYKVSNFAVEGDQNLNEHYNQLQQLKNNLETYINRQNSINNKSIEIIQRSKSDAWDKRLVYNNSTQQKRNIVAAKIDYSCKESYLGHTKGFRRQKCQRMQINKIVSIILDRPLVFLGSNFILDKTINIASQTFTRVFVLLESKVCESLHKMAESNVNLICIHQNNLFGQQINQIVLHNITTPFIVIAPRIGSLNYPIDIERMLDVHELTKAHVVGAATKNIFHKRWDRGCYQVSLQLYKLKYSQGYKESQHECLRCDFLSGPFLSTVDFLRSHKFAEYLSEGIYEDFFLKLKINHNQTVVLDCPDVMAVTYENHRETSTLVSFANFWDISYFKDYTQNIYQFSCPTHSHKQIVQKCRVREGLAIPLCCLRLLQDGLYFLIQLCRKFSLVCELKDGSVLGAVKFHGLLPWEQDADISLSSEDLMVINSLKNVFSKNGYEFIMDEEPTCNNTIKACYGGVAHIRVYHWSIQLFAHSRKKKEVDQLTMIKLHNFWVNGPENPGLYARNLYGFEIYKHAEHWMSTGKKDPLRYKPGQFEPCPKPGHHACLNDYDADGDLQFLQ